MTTRQHGDKTWKLQKTDEDMGGQTRKAGAPGGEREAGGGGRRRPRGDGHVF